ncbi:MAG: protein kinase [Myxococcaceae bacterium]|nr:protein kinase [Myxococcaceae bacterium]
MSEIFLAHQTGLAGFRKVVVLKSILPDIRGEEEFVRMFLEEARTTAAFNHPNIAQVFDLDTDDDQLFIAMEFVQGCTLVEMARACRTAKEPIPIGFTLQSVRDTALALHYAHTFMDPRGRRQMVIHRDVAEKNIMVTYEGTTKLLDFGIAKAMGKRGANLTNIGMVKGTSGYMSPEQIRGEPLDPRSDVFSLGVVLHECLTGMRLFHGKSAEDGMMAALREEVQPPSRLNPEVTEALDEVTLKALARERDARFSTALEFARAIEKACPGLIWHPEQTGELVARHFAERRGQTRELLEEAQGHESTSELNVDRLLRNRDVKTAPGRPSLVPPLASPPRRPSAPGANESEARRNSALVPPPVRRDSKAAPAVARSSRDTTNTDSAGDPLSEQSSPSEHTEPGRNTLESEEDDDRDNKTLPAGALPELRHLLEGQRPTGEFNTGLGLPDSVPARTNTDETVAVAEPQSRRRAVVDGPDRDHGVSTAVGAPFDDGPSRTSPDLGPLPPERGTIVRTVATARWFAGGVAGAVVVIVALLYALGRGPFTPHVAPPQPIKVEPKAKPGTPPKAELEAPKAEKVEKPEKVEKAEAVVAKPPEAAKTQENARVADPEPKAPPAEKVTPPPAPRPEPKLEKVVAPAPKPEPVAIKRELPKPASAPPVRVAPVPPAEPKPKPEPMAVVTSTVQLVIKGGGRLVWKGKELGVSPVFVVLPVGRQTVSVYPVEGGPPKSWVVEVKESGGSIRGDVEDL